MIPTVIIEVAHAVESGTYIATANTEPPRRASSTAGAAEAADFLAAKIYGPGRFALEDLGEGMFIARRRVAAPPEGVPA